MEELIVAKDKQGELVVKSPFGNEFYSAMCVGQLIAHCRSHLESLEHEFHRLGDLKSASLSDLKPVRVSLQEADDSLKDYIANLKDALLKSSGFDAFKVQTQGTGARIDPLSIRGRIREMIVEIKEVEDSRKPAETPEKRLLVIDATPSQWKTIETAITKAKVKKGAMVPLNSAKRIDAVAKVIKAIESEIDAANAAMGNL